MITKPIQTVSLFPDKTACRLSFTSAILVPDSGAQIFYGLENESGKTVLTGSLQMSALDYDAWRDSDEYPLIWAAGKLGLVLV